MKKIFKLTYSQENANLNCSEISPHIFKMINIKKEKTKLKNNIIIVGENWRNWNSLHYWYENIIVQPLQKTVCGSSKIKIVIQCDPAISLLGI